ncbi:thiamine-phosphate kinase [candidate division WOR-3 bacterium]|nr:thiamine-phosphate kinase [candidate division WOR-3 bacterium]
MSELEIIEYIRKQFPIRNKEIVKGIGDDGMVFRNGYVVSVDSFYEGVHFDRTYYTMEAIGHHTMAAALSDLAAMGARPVCALVSLCCAAGMRLEDIKALYSGFKVLSKRYGFDITGGDVVRGPGFGLSITVIGKARSVMERSGARPGDGLYVTNFLGLAEVGRHVLRDKLLHKEYRDSIKQHLFPEPRFHEARSIKKYASACIDTSDGLSTDAMHLAEESKVRIIIDAEHIPIHSEVGEFCTNHHIDALDHILASGEDFELLFTAGNVPRQPGLKIFKIGHVEKGRGLYLSQKGRTILITPTGYEHLKP